MKDNFHFFMSIFVIVLVSFFVLIVSMPLETNMEETVRKSSLHPCQKTVMFLYELHKKDQQMHSSLARDQVQSWDKFTLERIDSFSNALQQNCQDNSEEWLTPEYQSKMRQIDNAGFN